jgi:hypothetical protein
MLYDFYSTKCLEFVLGNSGREGIKSAGAVSLRCPEVRERVGAQFCFNGSHMKPLGNLGPPLTLAPEELWPVAGPRGAG